MILELFSSLLLLFFLSLLRKNLQNRKRQLPPSPLSLPIIGHLHFLGPLIHHSFRELSSRYGPLIYLKLGSVPCVVASSPELAKEILRGNELSFSTRMNSLAINHVTYGSSFSFSPYGPYWKFVKKLTTSELVGNRMLHQFLPIRAKEYRAFLQILYGKSKVGEVVNVSQELMKLSNNIISRMMLGVRSSDTDDQAEVARNLAREVTHIFGEFNVSDFIWIVKNLDLQGFRKRYEDIHRRWDDYLEKIITNREQVRRQNKRDGKVCERKDFMDILLDALEDDKAEVLLTRDNIKALVLDFLTAATDTTAILLEWALAELISNPKVLHKAREEINEVVGSDRLVEESDSPNLPYIHAIIKETFRLHPPIPMVSRKSVQDCNIGGYTIPSNALLFINVWAIGRDHKYWEDPLVYQPERFLNDHIKGGHVGGTVNIDIRGQHFELLPFGAGRRSCVGMSLAMLEMPVTLANMIQCFDWKATDSSGVEIDGALDMSERPGLTAPRAHGLVCFPKARMVNVFSDE